MGSIGNPSTTNWPPYNGYRDCSQGICSMYCPQWCYIIFPPPPPFQPQYQDSGTNFSPLIIVVIGILASAFLLVSYYMVISKYCRRRGGDQRGPVLGPEGNENQIGTHDQWQHVGGGLDETSIKSIAVCKYKKGGGVVEGSDCAVCLSEFREGESLRLLPKCSHAFHLPCIDTWLRSHSNCPLCRSHVMPGVPIPFQRPLDSRITSSNFNMSSLEFQRRSDLVLVVEEEQRNQHRDEVVVNMVGGENLPKHPLEERQRNHHRDDVVVNIVDGENIPKYPFQEVDCNVDGMMDPMNMGVEEITRSTSLGSMYSQNPSFLISNILRIQDDEDCHHVQVGSSTGENSKSNKRINRSISTGRFMSIRNDKGKSSFFPT